MLITDVLFKVEHKFPRVANCLCLRWSRWLKKHQCWAAARTIEGQSTAGRAKCRHQCLACTRNGRCWWWRPLVANKTAIEDANDRVLAFCHGHLRAYRLCATFAFAQ